MDAERLYSVHFRAWRKYGTYAVLLLELLFYPSKVLLRNVSSDNENATERTTIEKYNGVCKGCVMGTTLHYAGISGLTWGRDRMGGARTVGHGVRDEP